MAWLTMTLSIALTLGVTNSITSQSADSVKLVIVSFDEDEKLENTFQFAMEKQLRDNGIKQVTKNADWLIVVRIREVESKYVVVPCYSITPKKFMIKTGVDIYVYGVHTIITDKENDVEFICKLMLEGLKASMAVFNF
jgi:hypothetical protein